jgi:hypothetical protein
MTLDSDLVPEIRNCFRLINGKLYRLKSGVWSDTSSYADKVRVRYKDKMLQREDVIEVLDNKIVILA